MSKESLTDKCSQEPVLLNFEGFIIRPFDGWHVWFENPSGEGTQLRKDVFLGTLVKLFERAF